MKLNNIKKHTNNLIRDFTNKNSVVIDATCGNGIDTEFLANRVSKVFAFDIQKIAIDATKNRCSYLNNIFYINDSHQKICNYVNENVDLVIFNLGYLPNSDLIITTIYTSTIKAIRAALSLLNVGAIIIITVYKGHDNGVESTHIEEFLLTLSPEKYAILKYQFLNLNNAPYNIVIEKK